MAITEFRISGVSGVAVDVPTHKFDVFDPAGVGATDSVGVDKSTFTIGNPFILSLKLYIYIIFPGKHNFFFFCFRTKQSSMSIKWIENKSQSTENLTS